MQKRVYMTRKTHERLAERLRFLTTERAKEIKVALKSAKSAGGGIHDNAVYESVLVQERILAQQIKDLIEKLQESEVIFIDDLPVDIQRVQVGTTVKVLYGDELWDKTEDLTILGSDDSDPDDNIISHLSPIGQALIGGSVGDETEATLPDGKVLRLKILEIKIAKMKEDEACSDL